MALDLQNLDLPFLDIVICFVLASWAWKTYLNLRQRTKLQETYAEQSKSLKKIQTEEDFNKTCSYALDKQNFGTVKGIWNIIETIAFLKLFVYPWVWEWAGAIRDNEMNFLTDYIDPESVQAIVFMWMTGTWDTIWSIPFDYYYDFVIEEKHGFNKKTLGLFITDAIKSFFIYTIFVSPLIQGWLMIAVIKWGGDNFPIYVCLAAFVLILVLLTVYPILIQPCFDKVEPLDENKPNEKELREEIESLSQGVGFPLSKLYKIDGSKRSSHSNAYQYGLCNNKFIVLFDTLFDPEKTPEASERCDVGEITAIMGHELGHWKYGHIWFNVGITEAYLLAQMSIFQLCMNNMNIFKSFGYKNASVYVGFMLFESVTSAVDVVMTFLMHWLSRTFEFQADSFGVELGRGEKLHSGLIKISLKNKGVLNSDNLYATYHYSHPPILQRLEAIKNEIASKTKKEG